MSVGQENLWTLAEIAAAVNGTLHGPDSAVTNICTDTRQLQHGDLFIAIKGPHFDGNDFAATALQNGAIAAITTHNVGVGSIVVADTDAALHDLAMAARARSRAKIFAITGSVGKTSAKEMLAACLSQLGKTHAARDSLNNQWGVPLSLIRMPRDTAYAVFEIGMNHAGEITPLSRMVAPHVALITAIAAVHIGNLGSIENIARAKAEIFAGLDSSGIAILPRDSAQIDILLAEARTKGLQHIMTFGTALDADYRIQAPQPLTFKTRSDGRNYTLQLGLPGAHMASNAVAVLAAVQSVTDDITTCFTALENLQPVTGRGNRHTITLPNDITITIIDETHNASPIAVRAALTVLAATQKTGRRIVVLGDMLELGDEAPALHAALAPDIVAAAVDLLLTAGDLMAYLHAAYPHAKHHFADATALTDAIIPLLQSGDTVLLKGSRGAKTKQVVEKIISISNG